MANFEVNPISGNLDLVGTSASYITGTVATPADLPVTVGNPAEDSVYLTKAGSGVWLINRRPGGLYCRTGNAGTLDDWTHLGAFPEVNSSANWALYDGADTTKQLKFDLTGITTGTTRTLTAPDASGRIQVEGQAIGDTTPAAGTFTTLNAAVASGVGATVTDTNTSVDYNNLFECVRDSNVLFSVRDDGIVTASAGVNASTNAALVTAGGGNGGVRIRTDYTLHWVSTGFVNTGTPDTFLRRDAQANTLAMYNSTNAQEFRLYNTRTSSTNFERLNFRWASNEFILDAEAGSAGGTLRGIKIGSATSSLLGFYGVTPVDQPATVTDPAGGGTIDAEARTAINAIIDRLQELGLIA